MDKDQIRCKLFDVKSQIEQEVMVNILDLPKIHDYQEPISDDFFKAVAKTDGFEIFNSSAI
jgi:hypothetical protein